ncbi:MAG: hypothetical protein H6738_16525 [Alphaproteobacteria bacterium]|nr:hypothetical protein [Alphaproteobacteria bacterium]MCB9698387.1 hypothetical protein [Alphaproteobacteria bacterium]
MEDLPLVATLDGFEAELVTHGGGHRWSRSEQAVTLGGLALAGTVSLAEHGGGLPHIIVVLAMSLGIWAFLNHGQRRRVVRLVVDATHLRITEPNGATTAHRLTELGRAPAEATGSTLVVRLPDRREHTIAANGSAPADVARIGRALNERCAAVAARMEGADEGSLQALRSVVLDAAEGG